jgi:hypothetical protein
VADVTAMTSKPPLAGSLMAVDATGVGRPVVDMFQFGRVGCPVIPVTITGGAEVTKGERGGWNVPKKELVGTLQLLLQTRRLAVAAALPHAATLRAELANFRVKVTAAATEVFGDWRAGAHDDLVLAVALAAWLLERFRPAAGTRIGLPHPSRRSLFGGRYLGTTW